jgi:uncharacterized protein
MQMSEQRRIAASPEVVWAALLDPEMLKVSMPGCESVSGSAEEGYDAVVVQKVGPVRARFAGTVQITEMVEPESLTLTGEGKGGAAGFAKGVARVRLEPDGEGTLLAYDVEAKVGGKLAQLGSRVIDGFARKLADSFFERFQNEIEGPDAEADPAPDAAGGAEAAPKKGWLKRMTGKE